MSTWHVSVQCLIYGEPAELAVARAGRLAAEDCGAELLYVSVQEGRRVTVAVTVESDSIPWDFPLQLRGAVADRLVNSAGHALRDWVAVEILSEEEAERRSATAGVPPLISTAEFAELLGVTVQRVYELEHERRKADQVGREHIFPRPVVRGYWLRAVAERYAAIRRRKPGPAPKA